VRPATIPGTAACSVERAHPRRRTARTPAEDGPAAGRIAAAFGTRKFVATFASFIPSAKTLRGLCLLEPRSAKGELAEHFFACPRILDGTILGRGLRYTNTTPPKSKPPEGNLVTGAGRCVERRSNLVHAPGSLSP